MVLTNNKYYADLLQTKWSLKRVHVMRHFAGADKHAAKTSKDYDLIWMGRFHPQKGLADLRRKYLSTSDTMPDSKVAIIGDGDKTIKSRLIANLTRLRLWQSVEEYERLRDR